MIGFSLIKFVNCKSCRLFIHKLGNNWMTIDNYFDHISARVLPACSKVFIYRFSWKVFPFESKWVPKWVPWIFLKTVFHKIYLVYSWILCPICRSWECNYSSGQFSTFDVHINYDKWDQLMIWSNHKSMSGQSYTMLHKHNDTSLLFHCRHPNRNFHFVNLRNKMFPLKVLKCLQFLQDINRVSKFSCNDKCLKSWGLKS